MAGSIRDVAKRAGVSVSTVSRILNQSAGVSSKKTAAVREAMEYYHYVPSQFGRSLAKQQSWMIGVYYPYTAQGSLFNNSANIEVLRGHDSVIADSRYSILLINESEGYIKNPQQRPKFVSYIEEKKIDGLMLGFYGADHRIYKEVENYLNDGFPIGYVEHKIFNNGLNVSAQQALYYYDALEHMYRSGHRRIAWINEYFPDFPTHKENLDEAVKRMVDLHPDMEIFKYPLVMPCEKNLMKKHYMDIVKDAVFSQKATVLFTGSAARTTMALGVCNYFDLKIPEDISIVAQESGADELENLYTSVDAIRAPMYDMGRELAKMLIDRIEGRPISSTEKLFQAQYISRGSLAVLSDSHHCSEKISG